MPHAEPRSAPPNSLDRDSASGTAPPDGSATTIWTVPNLICLARIFGSLWLIVLACQYRLEPFVILFVILNISDWLDGPIARLLRQTSDFGARLDSISDAFLYGALLFGMLRLKFEVMMAEWPWWGMVILSYSLTCLVSLAKFGRLPSYHTYSAKVSQCLVLVGVVFLLLDYSPWAFRISALGVALTNLEGVAITRALSRPRCDVWSYWQVRQLWRDDDVPSRD